MIFNNKLSRNAFFAGLQYFINGILFFILYKYLINILGERNFGIWALILGASYVVRLGELGFSIGLIKFVSKYRAKNDYPKVNSIIETAVVSVFVLLTLISVLAYYFICFLLPKVLPPADLVIAIKILPYALISFIVINIASLYTSVLDGFMRIVQRSIVNIISACFYVVLSLLWAAKDGIMGLAYAQCTQSFILLGLSVGVAKYFYSSTPVFHFLWRKQDFIELWKYGANLQIITFTVLLCDPITKLLITKYGDVVLTGYFEIANRFVTQIRALIVQPSQTLLPVISEYYEKGSKEIERLFKSSNNIIFKSAFLFLIGIIIASPILSIIILHKWSVAFIIIAISLGIAYYINIIALMPYLFLMGIGKLKWVTISHVATALLNICLGYVVGTLGGGISVVYAWSLSIIIGSAIIIIKTPYKYSFPLSLNNN